MSDFAVRPIDDYDRPWVKRFLEEHWGSVEIVTRGKIHQGDQLPGFIAIRSGEPAGLITYRIDGDECEVISLNSIVGGIGIGTALLDAAKGAVTSAGCKRLWLITTNDNLDAIRFYQKRGMVLAALYKNELEHSRKLKPTIPLIGINGIPLRDEIELEVFLQPHA